MTPDPAIATAADYADAMLTARRAKNVLVLLLLLMLLGQLALFFVTRYTDVISTSASTDATTQPTSLRMADVLNYLTDGCLFFGLTLSIVLSLVVLLVVNIMLVGRLIGVARLTGAYIWSLILVVLLFPWQAFLNNAGLTMDRAGWKLPGVLYTWSELAARYKFANDPFQAAMLSWMRFVGWPLVAVIILLIIQIKTNRGMRQALGEEESATMAADTTAP